ncbi:MAG TPA: hypothetical protein GX404_08815 [Syntrophomonadaceae bacterium]|nr:hypothetical protein [Syntrophomonadaceae bacterium]
MELLRFENLRFIDRNKIGGDAIFNCDGEEKMADFHFYVQGDQCLSIRLGRHDADLETEQLQNFIRQRHAALKKQVNPEVKRLRAERRRALYGED